MKKISVLLCLMTCAVLFSSCRWQRTCQADGCTAKAWKTGCTYCETHRCHADGCDEISLEDGLYCHTHTCRDAWCLEQATANGYCAEHQK